MITRYLRIFKYIFILLSIFHFTQSKCVNRESMLLFSLTGDNKARVGVVNPGNRNIRLTVSKKNTGEILFNRYIDKHSNYFKFYNLSKLPDGRYVFTLSGYGKYTEKKIEIKNSEVVIVKEKTDPKPLIYYNNDGFLILICDSTASKLRKLTILSNNNVIYEDNLGYNDSIYKRYSLEKLGRGKYEVNFFTGNKLFTYDFEKE